MQRALKLSSNKVDFRFYVASLIFALVVAGIGVSLTSRAINRFYYDLLNQQSAHHATNFAQSISKSAQATDVIDGLLTDKLLSASKTVALAGDDPDNPSLAGLAQSLGLDELYYFNQDGVIVSSNRAQYIGWTSYPGHPVEIFRTSPTQQLVEDIRPDSESGELYKYAYIKTDRGFFQLGIRASRVYELMEAFEPKTLIAEMATDPSTDTICLLSNDFVIQASSEPDLVGSKLEGIPSQAAWAKDGFYATLSELNHRKVYQVLTPIIVDANQVGILSITKSLTATEDLVRRTTRVAITVIAITYISLSYTLYSSYQKKKQLLHLAFHDSTSGLPNRRYLRSILEANTKEHTALLLIHLTNFNTINHLYGFHYGEALVRTLAISLQEAFQGRYFIAHFSGNRLAMYVSDSLLRHDLSLLADEVVAVIGASIEREGFLGQIDAQIAIVEIPNANADPERVFTNASLALMNRPNHTADKHSFYNSYMEERLLRTDTIEQALRDHLANPASTLLWLVYQPIIDLKTGAVVGFEALSRMQLPELGVVSPLEFVSIAERKGLIGPLSIWVLTTACGFLNQLQERGFGHIRVSVNVSGTCLFYGHFYDDVQEVLQQQGISPHRITLEITESVMFQTFSEVNTVFQRFRNLGIKIAVDDFGTGYSSFSRIEDLAVDIIKIDKFFVDTILKKEEHRLIVGEIVAMCRKLGLKVVAEGVETEKQRQYLVEHHCDMMQGFLFSRPLPKEQALAKIKEHNG